MGSVEDLRQLLQDFLAPELRAVSSRLDAIEARIEALSKSVDARFEATDARIEAFNKSMDSRFEFVNYRFDALDGKIAQIKELIDVDRRLARLESKQAQVAQ